MMFKDLYTKVYTLTIWFFIMVLLCATQDIAVDGWSTTILSKENINYQGTCETFGLKLGYAISHPLFLVFNSHEICKKYFNLNTNLLTISQFLYTFFFFFQKITKHVFTYNLNEYSVYMWLYNDYKTSFTPYTSLKCLKRT